MAAVSQDDLAPLPAGYRRARSGTLYKIPNPARSGEAVRCRALEGVAAQHQVQEKRKAKPVKATLKKLAEAYDKALSANKPGTSVAELRRANATIDRALHLPVQSIEEFAGMLRLALARDGGSLSAPCRYAIESIAAGLVTMCVEGCTS